MKASTWLHIFSLIMAIALVYGDKNQVDDDEMDESVPVSRQPYRAPQLIGDIYLFEPFQSQENFQDRWVLSKAKKDGADADIAKYDGEWIVEPSKKISIPGDSGLVMKSRAKHYAISAKLDKEFVFDDKPFIVQYEVQFQNSQECGGAYIKLLSASDNLQLDQLQDKTAYTIMFGPDKCGEDKKLHFIFRHQNPVSKEFEEKHAKKPDADISKYFDDKTHLYKLVINPDNSFQIYVDSDLVNAGSLLEDFQPPVNPPEYVDDSDDKKPDDWDNREKIDDPDARKPDDWDEDEPLEIPDTNTEKPATWLDDEPQYIPDPTAKKPDDWDSEMDGDWEPPLIDNPKCKDTGCGEWQPPKIRNPKFKGKWLAPKIENPNYQGEWKPKQIRNPNFFNDQEPYKMTTIGAVGFELWSISSDIYFDNLLITSDEALAFKATSETWQLKTRHENAVISGSFLSQFTEAAQERPWLWVIYGIVLTVPFIILGWCCFPRKRDEAAERKRTDAPSPDDTRSSRQPEERRNDDESAGDQEATGTTTTATTGDIDNATASVEETDKPEEEEQENQNEEEDDNERKNEEKEPEARISPRRRKKTPKA